MQNHSEQVKRDEEKARREQALLQAVALEIAADAREAPEAYIQETLVPEGGE